MSFDSDMEARLQIVTCNIRIVGGCMAGHVPWYVYIIIGITNKCGGGADQQVLGPLSCPLLL